MKGFCRTLVKFLIFPSVLVACSTSAVVLSGKEFSSFEQIDFETIRFRRPEGGLYDSEVTRQPGVYKSLGNFDCERPESFFSRLKLPAIRLCLEAVGKEQTSGESLKIDWKLSKESQPALKLSDPDDAPSCLRELLSEIPFPRELIFIAENDEGQSACFSSRLALESGVLLGWEVPASRVRLRVAFPLSKPPTTDAAVERLLRTWVLSIFRGAGAENQRFQGRFLPTRHCLRCLELPESSEHGPARIPSVIRNWPALDDGQNESLR